VRLSAAINKSNNPTHPSFETRCNKHNNLDLW